MLAVNWSELKSFMKSNWKMLLCVILGLYVLLTNPLLFILIAVVPPIAFWVSNMIAKNRNRDAEEGEE